MPFSDYAELQTAISTHLRRDDLTSEIIDFISLAEARFNRKLRVREMMSVTTDTIANSTITLPTDWLAFHEMYISGSPNQILTQYTPDQQNTFDNSSSIKPYGYTIKGDKVYFYPNADSAYTVGYTYFQQIPPLATNSTNWLLERYPDIYLYGALLASAPAIKDLKIVDTWAGFLRNAVEEMEESGEADLWSGPLIMRVS